jgi:hypothetical protein
MTVKSQTDRPRIRPSGSVFSRSATAARPKPTHGSLTYAFDPYSSSDTSSSEDDFPTYDTIAESPKQRQESLSEKKKSRRDSSSGPYSRFQVGNEHFRTKGKVSKWDGRLKISVNETANTGYLAKALGASVRNRMNLIGRPEQKESCKLSPEPPGAKPETLDIPSDDDEIELHPETRIKLNIVIIVIGSRGDIQPLLKIGKILKEEYGHRVRIATHPAFKKFVEQDSGLEFFSVGGDPSELMAFMVKNPGLIPSMETVKAGEIGRRRAGMYDMFQGMWRACINATDDETDKDNMKMSRLLEI